MVAQDRPREPRFALERVESLERTSLYQKRNVARLWALGSAGRICV